MVPRARQAEQAAGRERSGPSPAVQVPQLQTPAQVDTPAGEQGLLHCWRLPQQTWLDLLFCVASLVRTYSSVITRIRPAIFQAYLLFPSNAIFFFNFLKNLLKFKIIFQFTKLFFNFQFKKIYIIIYIFLK